MAVSFTIFGRRIGLNVFEEALYEENEDVGRTVVVCAAQAMAVTTVRYTTKSRTNGNGDAFRHAYWNALMAERVGVEWAKRWGDAHEASGSNTGLPKEMDLWNNQVGRNAVESEFKEKSSDAFLANAIQRLVRAGVYRQINDILNRLVPSDSSGERCFGIMSEDDFKKLTNRGSNAGVQRHTQTKGIGPLKKRHAHGR